MRLSEIMSGVDLSFWPQAALVIFLIAFAAVMVRLFGRSTREEMDAAARIPLEDSVVTPRVGVEIGDETEAGR
jgi:cbb3-type cytochrome oxidase subunit 3